MRLPLAMLLLFERISGLLFPLFDFFLDPHPPTILLSASSRRQMGCVGICVGMSVWRGCFEGSTYSYSSSDLMVVVHDELTVRKCGRQCILWLFKKIAFCRAIELVEVFLRPCLDFVR